MTDRIGFTLLPYAEPPMRARCSWCDDTVMVYALDDHTTAHGADTYSVHPPYVDEHGPWNKDQQRYEDGCKSAEHHQEGPLDELEFIHRVLGVFYAADARDSLLWCPREDGSYGFSANVSDVFYWGTADAEDITEENLPLLEQALNDAVAAGVAYATPDLFAARQRNLRPQGAATKHMRPEERALYESLPERTTDLFNPKPWAQA